MTYIIHNNKIIAEPLFLDLPSTDLRLDSFCAYLLRNQEKERVLELCLLEQFSLPGLDAQNDPVRHWMLKYLQLIC